MMNTDVRMNILKNTKIKDFYNRINNIPIEYNLTKYNTVLNKIDNYDISKESLIALRKRDRS